MGPSEHFDLKGAEFQRFIAAFTLHYGNFNDLIESITAVQHIVAHGPSAVEILDNTVINLARENLTTAPLCDVLEGDPASVLIVEFLGDTDAEAEQKIRTMIADLQQRGMGCYYPIISEPARMARVWALRKNGLGLMLGLKGDKKPLPFIEDAAVSLDVLAPYVKQVLDYCAELETKVAMYAHASVGLIHLRPILDLRCQEDIDRMVKIAEFSFELAVL